MERTVFYSTMTSPIGELTLTSDGDAVTGVYMHRQKSAPQRNEDWKRDDDLLGTVREELQAYFAGELKDFDLSLAPQGTEFQQRVWRALRDIPYGETISYGELAARIGQPNASRAVGMANGQNPISIVVPCHRVIGADGTLTGYGGGIERKRWLLAHESKGSLI